MYYFQRLYQYFIKVSVTIFCCSPRMDIISLWNQKTFPILYFQCRVPYFCRQYAVHYSTEICTFYSWINMGYEHWCNMAQVEQNLLHCICMGRNSPTLSWKAWFIPQYMHSILSFHKLCVTHCGLVAPHGTKSWVNIGSGNGLLPGGTKPLPELMLIYYH